MKGGDLNPFGGDKACIIEIIGKFGFVLPTLINTNITPLTDTLLQLQLIVDGVPFWRKHSLKGPTKDVLKLWVLDNYMDISLYQYTLAHLESRSMSVHDTSADNTAEKQRGRRFSGKPRKPGFTRRPCQFLYYITIERIGDRTSNPRYPSS
jgi:hypothetical protein